MKHKKLLITVFLVAILAISMIALVACNKNTTPDGDGDGTTIDGNNSIDKNKLSQFTYTTTPDSKICITGLKEEYRHKTANVVIPEGVTSIDDRAFSNDSKLETVIIPDSVTKIGESAFSYCPLLTHVTIGNGVTRISDFAFYFCTGLMNIVIPDSVTSIGEEAFNHCIELISIIIPDSVTRIERCAFYFCTKLTSVTIGKKITSIEDNAFVGCYRLVEVYNKSNLNITTASTDNGEIGFFAKNIYSSESESKLTMEDGFALYHDGNDVILITQIGYDKVVTIPETVTIIDDSAFYLCNNLISVIIPDTVTSIRAGAFNCCSIRSITIPDSITVIEDCTFSNCFELTSIVIPKSVSKIGANALFRCNKLKIIYYKGTAEDWENVFIDGTNILPESTTYYYYSENKPTDDGNYWHYVDGSPTVWAKEN